MYEVALMVSACLRAGTRVDIAWPVDAEGFAPVPGVDALALTPGGGRMGALLDGLVDGALTEVAQRQLSTGRLVDVTVSDVAATIAGHAQGGRLRCAVVPADTLPAALWPLLLAREPVALVATLDGDDVVATHLAPLDGTADVAPAVAEIIARGTSTVVALNDALVTVLRPIPRLVVAGSGPIAEALAETARLIGWTVSLAPETPTALGLMAGLSRLDSAVVMGHDVESSSRVLEAALDSSARYVGALGSLEMQGKRADWLAYRGVTDLTRVHGPAGIDIGARTPAEIAVSIIAEAIATARAEDRTAPARADDGAPGAP
jgi:xanthine dehydrogenase accessory factor